VLIWGDRPGGKLIIGGSLVLLGILLITLLGKRKALQPAADPQAP
jgi:drug/metabolite transporter (DMT)-like permease